MIERGKVVEHRKDYIGEHRPPWDFENRTKVNNLLTQQDYAVQSKCYAFTDATKHFFGNDRELPYTTEPGTGFDWIRGNSLGGKSLLWHRQSYRLSDNEFNANKLDGHGIDWPIRYKDLEPWYSYVEKHAGISGYHDNLPQIPDSEFLPGFEWMTPEKDIKAKLAKAYPDRPMIMGRCAHLTEPTQFHIEQGRMKCMARNECQKGCSFGAYFSTQSSTLPAAVKTGNLHIAPNSVVHSVIYDDKRERVRGVRVIDNDTLKPREYFGKVVFLCASTLGSTQVLMNSKSARYPNGLANDSGVLGHYLMDHCYQAGADGTIDGYEDEYYSGRRPTGPYIPNFRYEPSRYAKGFVRGYSLAANCVRGNWRGAANNDGVGADFKSQLTKPGPWHFGLYAQGEMLPRYENQVSLHPTRKDKWGIPILHFNVRWSENERLMMEDAAEQAEKMLIAADVKNVVPWIRIDENNPGNAIHEVGTARMGRDPKESVVNGFCQAHGIPNLFVTDGSVYCSVGVVNPSLTFMAMTARAANYCAEEMKNRRI